MDGAKIIREKLFVLKSGTRFRELCRLLFMAFKLLYQYHRAGGWNSKKSSSISPGEKLTLSLLHLRPATHINVPLCLQFTLTTPGHSEVLLSDLRGALIPPKFSEYMDSDQAGSIPRVINHHRKTWPSDKSMFPLNLHWQ